MLTLIEERCEINLRSEEPEKALLLLKEHLWEAQLRGDLAGQCVVHFFISRPLLLKNSLREANQALQNSITISERQNYRKTFMRSLFLCAGIHWHLKELDTAARILERAGNEAIRLALPLHIECFNILKLWLNNGYLPLKPLFDSQMKTGSIAQIKYLLKSLGVTGAQHIAVQVQKTTTLFDSVFEYLESTLNADSLEFIASEKFIAKISNRKIIFLELHEKIPVNMLIEQFIMKQKIGLTIEECHKGLGFRNIFNPDRHAHRYHSLFSTIRKKISIVDATLRYDKIKMRYFFESALPLRIVTFKGTVKTVQKITAREQQILNLFVQKNTLLSSEIVKSMKVTRQTLSPMLQKLVRMGLIRLHFRGRSSRYSGV